MKIVFLTPKYRPSIGGVEKHVFKISQLMANEHTITTICESNNTTDNEHDIYPEAEVYRINVSGLSESNKKFRIWKWIVDHKKVIIDADVIHIHDVFYWLIPIIPFISRSKTYITFHGYEGSGPPNIKQIYWHKIAQAYCRGNICIGAFHSKWYGVKPTIVNFGATDLTLKDLRKRNNKIIFIGRLHNDNGIMEYVKSTALIPFHLDIFGDGPQRSEVLDYINKHKLNITFHGFHKDPSVLLEQYSYAFVSRYLSIIDSLKVKTPVIAHYNNQIKKDYLIYQSPFANYINIVNTKNDIINCINRKNSKSDKISGYLWAKNQTWEKMVSDYYRLYKI